MKMTPIDESILQSMPVGEWIKTYDLKCNSPSYRLERLYKLGLIDVKIVMGSTGWPESFYRRKCISNGDKEKK